MFVQQVIAAKPGLARGLKHEALNERRFLLLVIRLASSHQP
jgi:hypothetical protein